MARRVPVLKSYQEEQKPKVMTYRRLGFIHQVYYNHSELKILRPFSSDAETATGTTAN